MSDAPYQVAHVSEIETPAGVRPGEAPWRAVRRHFGIGAFGISAYLAEAAGPDRGSGWNLRVRA